MNPISQDVTIKATGKKTSFHIINDNVVLAVADKTVQGTVGSYVSSNIADSFKNGSVNPVKNSRFTISKVDLANVDSVIQTYVTENLEAIVNNEMSGLPA